MGRERKVVEMFGVGDRCMEVRRHGGRYVCRLGTAAPRRPGKGPRVGVEDPGGPHRLAMASEVVALLCSHLLPPPRGPLTLEDDDRQAMMLSLAEIEESTCG